MVAKADAPEFRRVGLGRVPSSEDDGLVTDQARGAVDRRGIEPPEAEVPLGPDDEYGPGIMEAFEAFEVNVSPVEDIDRSRLGEEEVEDTNVVYAAVGDPDPGGDVAPEVQQGVQFDGPLRRSEGSPGEEGEAEVDGAGIQGIDGLIEFDVEGFAGVQTPRLGDQHLSEFGVDAPVSPLVGIGQGAARHLAAKTHVVEFVGNGAQAYFDVPQASPVRELRKGHRQELVPVAEATSTEPAGVPAHAAAEGFNRNEVHELGEHGAPLVHLPLLGGRKRHDGPAAVLFQIDPGESVL